MGRCLNLDVERAAAECARFLGCLFERDDLIEFSAIPSGAYRAWDYLESLIDVCEQLWKHNKHDNAFFGANPRSGRGGKKEDVACARCLFVDFDFSSSGEKGCSFEDAERRVSEANLPTPTAWVSTGSGMHAYWRLDGKFADLNAWEARQAGLIRKLNTDASIKNANRLMRLPGFRNPKYAHRPLATLLDADPARVYGIEEFPAPYDDSLSMAEALKKMGPIEPGSLSTLSKKFLDTGYTLAGGRRQTMFTVACDMQARGWTLPEATGAILERMRQFSGNGGLSQSDLADCPRQIRNAFAKARDPIADTVTPDEAVIPASHDEDVISTCAALGCASALDLIRKYESLRDPVIHGLLREGETMNVIAAPKTGKSWLVMDLAFAMAQGAPWLGIYATVPGEVLILDNELHPETSASRVRTIMDARRVPVDFAARVTIENLRGKLRDLGSLGPWFRSLERGRFKLVVFDAFYRFMPREWDENDNGTMAAVYNLIDSYSAHLGCATVCIHHASKGNQSGKSVTDVGAGAGAQSRAADTHLTIRQHEQQGAVVIDAAVRSWAPVVPRAFRFEFPVFNYADDLDPAELAGLPKRKASDSVSEAWTAQRLLSLVAGRDEFMKNDLESLAGREGLSGAAFDRLWNSTKHSLTRRRVGRDWLFSVPRSMANGGN